MNERIPPHSADAEKSVLGALMLDRDALFQVMEILKPEDFYSDAHKEIYRAAEGLHRKNEPVDTLTVSDELKRRKSLDMAGGRGYIAALSTMVPATANAAQYARIVAEKAVLRRLIGASSEIMDESYGDSRDAREILDDAERKIFAIAQAGQHKDFSRIGDVLFDNYKHINEIANLKGLTGLTTGFIDLDKKTSGLQRSDMIIVAARPGMGKTAFALNIAHKAALRVDAKVLIFSLEMSKEQLVYRFLSLESHVEITRLRDGKLNEDEWTRINEAMDVLQNTDIFIDDTPGIPVMEIRNKARRMKSEHGLDLIIVDYLQLMSETGRTENRNQEISVISRMFKQLAREMDCPVIVLSQLSREVDKRKDKIPVLSDLRDSGAIEQDADLILFLHREDYYTEVADAPDATQNNLCRVIIAKHRNGETGFIELSWVGRYTKFADRARDVEPSRFSESY
ncbi:MAG: replicative DNA helicase [Clostridiales Family XIII bacterium]|jgi:replicative DNA helicase|nr:replicative DNA helicase [Clostridiales Family XIII bacterium]